MGYRKKNPSIIEIAIQSSWKFSAVVATLILFFSYLVIPFIFSSSTLFKVLIPALQSLSIFVASIFAIIAVFKLGLILIRDDEQRSQIEEVEKFIAAKKNSRRPPANYKETNARVEPTIDSSNLENDIAVQQSEQTGSNEQTEISIQERWTLELINSLDWKIFEELCGYYFDEIGVKNQQTSLGADGGIDLILFENDSDEPTTIVQCKKWSNPVGVRLMREFLGVMHHNKIERGIYVTTDSFNDKAIIFARENNIELVDGGTLLSKIKALPLDAQEGIYNKVTSGDFTTPTCVKCGSKMALKKNGDKQFWGCSRYPKCRSTLSYKPQPKPVSPKNNLLY